MESLVHSRSTEHGNYNISLLIPEQTVLCDSSTRRDFYVFALLRFDIVKNSIRNVSFLLDL